MRRDMHLEPAWTTAGAARHDGFDPEAPESGAPRRDACTRLRTSLTTGANVEKKTCGDGPMAFKGFPPPEMCGGYDDCTPGYGDEETTGTTRIRTDEDDKRRHDLLSKQAISATTGRIPTMLDEDLDGNVDHENPTAKCTTTRRPWTSDVRPPAALHGTTNRGLRITGGTAIG